MKDQHTSSPDELGKSKKEPPGQLGCWVIVWFSIAAAMAIWPHAFGFRDYVCDPDELIGCFISNSWGTPLGIAISLIFGSIALWNSIRFRDRAALALSEQAQATPWREGQYRIVLIVIFGSLLCVIILFLLVYLCILPAGHC